MKKLLAAVLMCWSALAVGQTAGKVDLVDGEVKIFDAARKERMPKVGDAINVGENVVTGADGELHLSMEDGGQIAVRPNTRMRIEKYKAEGGADDRSVVRLLQGAMRSVTGWIGRYSPKNYQIHTPTATIGVRGTDHETHVIPPGSPEGEAGTYDKVNAGSTLLRTAQGTTEIRPSQAAFAAFSGKKRPALLHAVPAFFRPSRHESRFADLHEKVHRQLEQRRDERVRKVREARGQFEKGRAERRLERQHDKARKNEQGYRQIDGQRNPDAAGARFERRQQLQNQRLQRDAGSRRENIEQRRAKAGADARSIEAKARANESRRPQAERRQQSAPESRRESGRFEGGGHRRH